MHQIKALIDVGELQLVRDQIVDVDLALHDCHAGAGKPCALDHVEPNAAQAPRLIHAVTINDAFVIDLRVSSIAKNA